MAQVEIITLQKCWIGGEPREPGYTTQMPLADAKYGESIGRLQIVQPDTAPAPVAEPDAVEPVEPVAEVVDEPVAAPEPVAVPAPKGKAAK